MRKRIKCRVIESVPLDKGRDTLRDVTPSDYPPSSTNNRAAFTYSSRLIATPTCLDDGLRPPILDLYA